MSCSVVWMKLFWLLLPPAVGAQYVVSLSEETTSHQRHGAQQAGETLAMPLALLKGDILSTCQTCTNTSTLLHSSHCQKKAAAF